MSSVSIADRSTYGSTSSIDRVVFEPFPNRREMTSPEFLGSPQATVDSHPDQVVLMVDLLGSQLVDFIHKLTKTKITIINISKSTS